MMRRSRTRTGSPGVGLGFPSVHHRRLKRRHRTLSCTAQPPSRFRSADHRRLSPARSEVLDETFSLVAGLDGFTRKTRLGFIPAAGSTVLATPGGSKHREQCTTGILSPPSIIPSATSVSQTAGSRRSRASGMAHSG